MPTIPPQWMLGEGFFQQVRGLTLDPGNKTVIVGDKLLNAIITFSPPEMFDDGSRQTAAVARR